MGIERYRAIVRLEEIRALTETGEYEAAKEIADTIKKERLKDSGDLFLLATVYRKCGEFGTAKEFLLRIYEKKVTWRVLEELMEVCLAEKKPEEAEQYLKQYVRLSGGDPRNYIYEYRIGRQMHRPDEELLPVLQTLKAEEYSEKYAYELAKLYHKLGREQECMEECADLILWFGDGTYVERAKVLQAYYRGELSADDIRVEAERRVQEAEQRRAREEEERLAFEKQRRLEEEQRLAEEERQRLAEEESRRLEEEEQAALDALYRSVAEEHFSMEGVAKEPAAAEVSEEDAEAINSFEENVFEEDGFEENGLDASAFADTREGGELDESFFEEVAAAMEAEPMWEEDSSIGVAQDMRSDEIYESFPEGATAEESEEGLAPAEEQTVQDYEQISLFAPKESVPEESKDLSPLGKELSARLLDSGIVFEDILHEFASIERVRKQLVRMLEVVVTVRKKCHCLIITGDKRSGKTSLGTYLAKLLYELSYVKSPRVAKISGERLNRINLFEKQEQLKDACLIVENAGTMTEATAEGLLQFIRQTDVLGTVILEDNANAINRLLRNHAECNREFNNRVHLPKYDTEELMLFALGSIAEQDYVISEETKKILFERIEYVTRVEPKEGRLWATMEMVKEALKNADDRNQGTILAMATAGSFLAAEALELTAEDFGV
ncbi:MAG: hypothetical protein IJ427_10955 [Lachnospiraceae bacterium]|nr:hypothetical protein [Lachnospiraceae bacterium]